MLPRTRRWFARDVNRTILVAVPLLVVWPFVVPMVGRDRLAVAGLIAMFVHAGIYTLLTWVTFASPRGPELDDLLAGSQRVTTGWRRWAESGNGPVSWSVLLSALCLLLALIVARSTDWSDGWALSVLCIVVVICAWATMVVSYALHYARLDRAEGGFEFPGDEPRAFSDYLYLSVAVATAFASSDVTVTARSVRRSVTGHAVLAFAFSAVVLATVISVL